MLAILLLDFDKNLHAMIICMYSVRAEHAFPPTQAVYTLRACSPLAFLGGPREARGRLRRRAPYGAGRLRRRGPPPSAAADRASRDGLCRASRGAALRAAGPRFARLG